jgi:hypothetical protein
MRCIVRHRQTSRAKLEAQYDQPCVIDVTSRADAPWVRFSPFFPHGGIPIPGSGDVTAQSVEGLWQGLKVFEHHGIDVGKFEVTSMKGLKRTVRRFGPCRGHQPGLHGGPLLDYIGARRALYLPAYRWVLQHRLQDELAQLHALAATRTVVLLDYETNTDVDDPRKPLSHAGLVAAWLEGRWPA